MGMGDQRHLPSSLGLAAALALLPMPAAAQADAGSSGLVLGLGLVGMIAAGAAGVLAWRLAGRSRDAVAALAVEQQRRETAEEQLARDRATWDTAPQGHLGWRKGAPAEANARTRQALGLASGPVALDSIAAGIHADDQATFQSALQALDREGTPFVLMPKPAAGKPRLRWVGTLPPMTAGICG